MQPSPVLSGALRATCRVVGQAPRHICTRSWVPWPFRLPTYTLRTGAIERQPGRALWSLTGLRLLGKIAMIFIRKLRLHESPREGNPFSGRSCFWVSTLLNLRTAARCAARIWTAAQARCPTEGIEAIHGAFSGYGRGASCDWPGAKRRVVTFRRLLARL